jgi:hypothetical protein
MPVALPYPGPWSFPPLGAEWTAKGAEFVTPPIDREAEIRCYLRDPDGYLIEVGQSTGLLQGKLAAKRPEDLPG